MNQDVIVKESTINGKGIFAARFFKEGEPILSWKLVKLTKQEVDKLPDEEKHYVSRYEGDTYLLHQAD